MKEKETGTALIVHSPLTKKNVNSQIQSHKLHFCPP